MNNWEKWNIIIQRNKQWKNNETSWKIDKRQKKHWKNRKTYFILSAFVFFEPDQRKTVKNSEKNNENKNEKQWKI